MTHNLVPISTKELEASMKDVAGQISPASQRIYYNDARVFATWLQVQGISPATMTRSDMIAYRSYLDTTTYTRVSKTGKIIGEPRAYSKTAKQRMFAVACRLMTEQHINGRSANVTEKVSGFKAGKNETTHTALSEPQAKEMLARIDTTTIQGKRDYALLLLLLKTGLRRAEAVALNREDITMRDGHHVAIIAHGKGDKQRIAKLRVEVSRAINTYLDVLPAHNPTDPVFVSIRRGDHPTSERLTDKTVESIVKRYAPEETDLTPHGLRATFATLALEAGAPLHQVQYAMGHSDPRTTERYQKRKLNLDHNAVDYLNF